MRCKHEACTCADASKDGHCSDSCKQAKMDGTKCACGHPDCA
jgi:hypothetical protein